jgi:LmbE family N-acetylglucosaminyl deacetylase
VSTLLVISPHLDDAVLSAGQTLAAHPGSVVVTVFAGVPDDGGLDDYDRACGFRSSREAMLHRRREDEEALALLGASPRHLDFTPSVGENVHGDGEIAAALDGVIAAERPAAVVGPAGIVHPDHRQVARAWPAVAVGRGDAYAYEELPYRVKAPRRAADAVAALRAAFGAAEASLPAADEGVKAKAMLAYASQLRLVFPLVCLSPERLWRLGF